MEILKERFGYIRLIFDVYVRFLIYLLCLSFDDVIFMCKFYDEVIGYVCFVEFMGEKFNFEILVFVFVFLIVDKLLKEVVEKWELEFNEEKVK